MIGFNRESFKKDSNLMRKAFKGSVHEIEVILESNKEPTQKTKISCQFIGAFSRVKSTEVHEMGLAIMAKKIAIKPIK
jgi:hypothetical protein